MAAGSALEMLRGSSPALSVGILTADLLNLGSTVSLLEAVDIPMVHFDVMDGVFCPMMTLGPPLVNAVRTPLLKDVHLMVHDPLGKVSSFVDAGADMITIHAESCPHLHRVFQEMGGMTNSNDAERGIVRGLALNPGTPLEAVQPVLDEIDVLTILAVNPGWGGQRFLESTRARISKARKMISDSCRPILLGVDGGITRDNVADVAGLGVDIIVTGSAVFDGKAPAQNARYMLDCVRVTT